MPIYGKGIEIPITIIILDDVMGEAKYRLLQDLVKKKTGLREVEEFVIRDRKTYQLGGGNNENFKFKKL